MREHAPFAVHVLTNLLPRTASLPESTSSLDAEASTSATAAVDDIQVETTTAVQDDDVTTTIEGVDVGAPAETCKRIR